VEPPRPTPPLRLIEGGGGAGTATRVDLEPPIAIATVGTGLVLTTVWMARLPSWASELGAFQGLFAVAFVFFALALWTARRAHPTKHDALVLLVVALAARVALLPVKPTLSDDVYRYVWEGRVVAHGGNPYRQSPLDPALASLRDREIHPRIDHPDLTTIHPPVGLAGFALVSSISPTIWAMKLWIVLHDLVIIWVLLRWSRARGAGAWAALAYAWNPLVLIEFAGQGHNDPTAMLGLVLALYWCDRRPLASATALALGSLVKLAPLVALPFLLVRWPTRARALALGVLVLGLGLFWREAHGANAGLLGFGRWLDNELLFHYLAAWTGDLARWIAISIVASVIGVALSRGLDPANGARLVTRTAFLVTPVAHPWSLGWVLVYEPLGPSLPWLLLSATAILSYGVLVPPLEGERFHLSLGWRWIEYGVPLALGIGLAIAQRGTARTTRED
jgi:hypothetical protein